MPSDWADERARAFKATGEARLADCEKRFLDDSETEEQMLALLAAELRAAYEMGVRDAAKVCDGIAQKSDAMNDPHLQAIAAGCAKTIRDWAAFTSALSSHDAGAGRSG